MLQRAVGAALVVGHSVRTGVVEGEAQEDGRLRVRWSWLLLAMVIAESANRTPRTYAT